MMLSYLQRQRPIKRTVWNSCTVDVVKHVRRLGSGFSWKWQEPSESLPTLIRQTKSLLIGLPPLKDRNWSLHVIDTIKAIEGRKRHPTTSTWEIPLTKSSELQSKLMLLKDPRANAIRSAMNVEFGVMISFPPEEKDVTKSVPVKDDGEIKPKTVMEGGYLRISWPYIRNDEFRISLLSKTGILLDGFGFRFKNYWKIPKANILALLEVCAGNVGHPTAAYDVDVSYKLFADGIIAAIAHDPVLSQEQDLRSLSNAVRFKSNDENEEVRARMRAAGVPATKDLYPFQYVGVVFVEKANGRALIGDDMGVGKTIQAIVYAGLHPENHPVLCVVPAHLRRNWKK